MKKVIEKHGLKVVLDTSEVFPDDPGQGTPAMVYNSKGACATYTCAANEGELENIMTGFINQLSNEQVEWLWSIEKEVEEFLYVS